MLQNQFDRLSTQKGTIGAFLGRLEIAARNVEAQALAKSEAESRIRDVDVASEVAELVKARILQQVSASLLAQSGLDARLALRLLQG
jgi:flagellin